jgi:uncharacterized protein (DUF1499 family)
MKNAATKVAIVLTVVAAAMILASGPALRLQWVDVRSGILMFAGSVIVAFLAAVIGGIAWLLTRPNHAAGIGFLAAALLVAIPASQIVRARGKPPIHDISTDPADPPIFSAVLPLRASAPNKVTPFDETTTQLQKRAYPDLGPLELSIAADAAYVKALDAAKQSGWEIVSARPSEGIVEATDTTAWFGFKDDVVVRVRSAGAGSRVDVRSTSRVGRGDAGKNAERIRKFLRILSSGK